MARYMILLRGDVRAWSAYAPPERRRLLEKYAAWVEDLRARGAFKGGDGLGGGGRLVRMVGGEVVESPVAEGADASTGYFLVEADGLDAAVAIARNCPALTHGETAEVREVGSARRE